MTVDTVEPIIRNVSNKLFELTYRETYNLKLKIGLSTMEAATIASRIATTVRDTYDDESLK